MRLILGIILGGALTVGGAYISDTAAGAGAKPMVNWDVVAKNFDEVSAVPVPAGRRSPDSLPRRPDRPTSPRSTANAD